MEHATAKRLGSLDVLRGFDLFCLVFFEPVFRTYARISDSGWIHSIYAQFQHVPWEGFVFWDLIMPLFMFMAGAAMPFAFAKYNGLERRGRTRLYQRILKRVILLWLFGMIAQGNLLELNPQSIYFYSNTLQAIAVGYMISAILLMHFSLRWQIIITSSFLLAYWALLTFVKVDGYGGGDFSPDNNLAEYIDRVVLGRFRDGAEVTAAGIDYGTYRYTWIISSLNFGVTVMSGVFAGHIMRSNLPEVKKIVWMIVAGVAMILAAQIWSIQMPIIKRIWTSSMTLYSSGLCFLLMALFYYLIDYRDFGRYLNWLKIYGMNAITAYMLHMVFDFSGLVHSLLYGTEQYLGDYYSVILSLGHVSVIFLILWLLYRQRKFLRV